MPKSVHDEQTTILNYQMTRHTFRFEGYLQTYDHGRWARDHMVGSNGEEMAQRASWWLQGVAGWGPSWRKQFLLGISPTKWWVKSSSNWTWSLGDVDEATWMGRQENSNNLLVTVELLSAHIIDEKHGAACFRGISWSHMLNVRP